jgi:L-aminopeptidase/D-esterase-like protein
MLVIFAATANAHTVTIANGLSGAGAGADVGTFGGAVADRVSLIAYNGAWYPVVNVNVTFA